MAKNRADLDNLLSNSGSASFIYNDSDNEGDSYFSHEDGQNRDVLKEALIKALPKIIEEINGYLALRDGTVSKVTSWKNQILGKDEDLTKKRVEVMVTLKGELTELQTGQNKYNGDRFLETLEENLFNAIRRQNELSTDHSVNGKHPNAHQVLGFKKINGPIEQVDKKGRGQSEALLALQRSVKQVTQVRNALESQVSFNESQYFPRYDSTSRVSRSQRNTHSSASFNKSSTQQNPFLTGSISNFSPFISSNNNNNNQKRSFLPVLSNNHSAPSLLNNESYPSLIDDTDLEQSHAKAPQLNPDATPIINSIDKMLGLLSLVQYLRCKPVDSRASNTQPYNPVHHQTHQYVLDARWHSHAEPVAADFIKGAWVNHDCNISLNNIKKELVTAGEKIDINKVIQEIEQALLLAMSRHNAYLINARGFNAAFEGVRLIPGDAEPDETLKALARSIKELQNLRESLKYEKAVSFASVIPHPFIDQSKRNWLPEQPVPLQGGEAFSLKILRENITFHLNVYLENERGSRLANLHKDSDLTAARKKNLIAFLEELQKADSLESIESLLERSINDQNELSTDFKKTDQQLLKNEASGPIKKKVSADQDQSKALVALQRSVHAVIAYRKVSNYYDDASDIFPPLPTLSGDNALPLVKTMAETVRDRLIPYVAGYMKCKKENKEGKTVSFPYTLKNMEGNDYFYPASHSLNFLAPKQAWLEMHVTPYHDCILQLNRLIMEMDQVIQGKAQGQSVDEYINDIESTINGLVTHRMSDDNYDPNAPYKRNNEPPKQILADAQFYMNYLRRQLGMEPRVDYGNDFPYPSSRNYSIDYTD